MADAAEDEVLLSVTDGVATVVLNRPKALNALNTYMVQRLSQLLSGWSAANDQPQVDEGSSSSPAAAVIVKGAGSKAFCAGGDVKWVVEQMAQRRLGGPAQFFTTEYKLNYQISVSPVPYVALIDGVTMGGGAGVSIHGHFRVATERTVFAMPECGIGLFPDVGASFFLSRLQGRLGLWLGLTGTRLEGVDVRAAGLATHYLPSHLLPEVETRLQRLGAAHLAEQLTRRLRPLDLSEVDKVLRQLEQEAGPLPHDRLGQKLPWINHHFAGASVAAILQSLGDRQQQLLQQPQQQASPEAVWLDDTLKAMSRGSPLSQCITFELLRRARHMTLHQCLQLDLKLVNTFTTGKGDFAEGVRATLVERGRKPEWKYAKVQEVPEQVVQSFFEEVSSL